MGRKQRSDRELDQLDRLKHENQKLKRENSRLRKVIDRMDLDLLFREKEAQETPQEPEMPSPDKIWKCYNCQEGTLRLKTIDRRDGRFYNRVCDGCGKRTKFQKWTKDVK